MSFNPHLWYLMGLSQSISTVKHLTLSTTSTSATWSPGYILNEGTSLLTWDVSGDITPTSQNVDDPTFNLSANTGTVNMDVYDVVSLTWIQVQTLNVTEIDVSQITQLQYLSCNDNQLTSLNVGINTLLKYLICKNNQLSALDVSNSPLLINLYCYGNNIPSLDLSNNINLKGVQVYENNMMPSATDQIYIDLANGIETNGSLLIRNNRTSASDTARATLVSRGWTFDESYTT